MRGLERKQLLVQAGLLTNFNNIDVQGNGCLIGQNVDTFDEWRSLCQIPGSVAVSADHGAAVEDVLHFEYQNLHKERTREQLTLSNGTLRKVNPTTGVLTVINYGDGTSVNDLVNEPLNSVVYNDQLYISGGGQNKLLTGGLRYDGNFAAPWGLQAPGLQETTILPLDDNTLWTINAPHSKSDMSAARSQDGGGAVQVDKASGNTTVSLSRTGLSLDISAHAQCFVWLFIPLGGLPLLDAGGSNYAVRIEYGDTSFTKTNQHDYEQGELVTGWNLIGFIPSSPTQQVGGGATLTSVTDFKLVIAFLNSTSVLAGFAWDRVYGVDEGAPTVANDLATAAGPQGSYTYRTTFVNDKGFESNAGAPSSSITAPGIQATGTLTFSGNLSQGDTCTIGTNQYFFETTLTDSVANRVFIGATQAATLANLTAAINNSGGNPGSDYSSATQAHPTVTAVAGAGTITVTAINQGVAGNSIATSASAVNLSWGNTTLTGGANGNRVQLTAIPISTAPDVIARRIYRDIDGDALWRFVGQIDNNVDTTYNDDISDAGLGVTQPPIAGDASIDNSPPGALLATTKYANRVFGISGPNRSVLMVSDINTPDAFKVTEQLVFDDELTGLAPHPLGLLVFGTDSVYILTGDGLINPFNAYLASTETGANGFRAVSEVRGLTVSVREEDVFVYSNPTDPWLLNKNIRDLFATLDQTKMDDMFILHNRARYSLHFFHPDGKIYTWQYGTHGQEDISGDGAGVDPLDIRRGQWWEVAPPAGVTWNGGAIVERAADVPEVWVAGSDGFVYRFFSPGATTWAHDSSDVTSTIESNAVAIGREYGGRGEVRYLELDMALTEAIDANDMTITVTLTDGSSGAAVTTTSWTHVESDSTDSSFVMPIPLTDQLTGEWVKVKLVCKLPTMKLRLLTLMHHVRGFGGARHVDA